MVAIRFSKDQHWERVGLDAFRAQVKRQLESCDAHRKRHDATTKPLKKDLKNILKNFHDLQPAGNELQEAMLQYDCLIAELQATIEAEKKSCLPRNVLTSTGTGSVPSKVAEAAAQLSTSTSKATSAGEAASSVPSKSSTAAATRPRPAAEQASMAVPPGPAGAPVADQSKVRTASKNATAGVALASRMHQQSLAVDALNASAARVRSASGSKQHAQLLHQGQQELFPSSAGTTIMANALPPGPAANPNLTTTNTSSARSSTLTVEQQSPLTKSSLPPTGAGAPGTAYHQPQFVQQHKRFGQPGAMQLRGQSFVAPNIGGHQSSFQSFYSAGGSPGVLLGGQPGGLHLATSPSFNRAGRSGLGLGAGGGWRPPLLLNSPIHQRSPMSGGGASSLHGPGGQHQQLGLSTPEIGSSAAGAGTTAGEGQNLGASTASSVAGGTSVSSGVGGVTLMGGSTPSRLYQSGPTTLNSPFFLRKPNIGLPPQAPTG